MSADRNVTSFDAIKLKKGNRFSQTRQMAVAGAQSTGTVLASLYYPDGGIITGIKGWLVTAPTGTTTFKVDVNINGVTVFTTQGNRLIWVASAHASSATLPDVVTIPADGIVSIDVDAVGSTIAGSDLFVAVKTAHNRVD